MPIAVLNLVKLHQVAGRPGLRHLVSIISPLTFREFNQDDNLVKLQMTGRFFRTVNHCL
jgi:hypothetical protein